MTPEEICEQNFEQKKEKTYCYPNRTPCILLKICNRPVDSRIPGEVKQWEEDLIKAAVNYANS